MYMQKGERKKCKQLTVWIYICNVLFSTGVLLTEYILCCFSINHKDEEKLNNFYFNFKAQ